ncbi:hypothetical protein NMY22_g13902 [Coprinellus aureogranulatus]|nr:hypothetical protein NMY22_g13902 [Coprinellus aureogranulatus]
MPIPAQARRDLYTEEQIQALTSTVGAWRLSEYVHSRFTSAQACQVVDQSPVPFHALYIYYVLTSIEEEVSLILAPKWSWGKLLFIIIRHGTVVYSALQLMRDYRTYLVVSPIVCKTWMVAYNAALYLSWCACDAALGLCLGALLQVKGFYLAVILTLAMGPCVIAGIFTVVAEIQYPAEPVTEMFKELGYPCYAPSPEQWLKLTLSGLGADVRAYLNFATTAVLLFLGGAALVLRYKGHKGRLIQILRRDGGVYFIALAGVRFGLALTNTPMILAASQRDFSPGLVCHMVLIPIFAQRLLINLRKADHMGSSTTVSRLLFAPSPLGSKDDEDRGNQGRVEMTGENDNVRGRAGAEEPPDSGPAIANA